jgi:hypothetical protein
MYRSSVAVVGRGLNSGEAFRRTEPRFLGFGFPIAGRRIRYQGMEEVLGSVTHIVHSAIERFFVRLRRFRKTAQLADELKR